MKFVKVAIVGHLTIDEISVLRRNREQYESAGGPPAYSGSFLSKHGLDVSVVTKVGKDFGNERFAEVREAGLDLERQRITVCDKSTTRFRIVVRKPGERDIFLARRCEDIGSFEVDHDLVMLMPTCREVKETSIIEARKAGYVYSDPQGFLRVNAVGKVWMERNEAFFRQIHLLDSMKVDIPEGRLLTGRSYPEDIGRALLKKGLKEVIVTDSGRADHLFTSSHICRLDLPRVEYMDGVGAGDILGAAYCSARMKEGVEYSFVYGVAAAIRRLNKRALAKVPDIKEVEELASSLYERLKRI